MLTLTRSMYVIPYIKQIRTSTVVVAENRLARIMVPSVNGWLERPLRDDRRILDFPPPYSGEALEGSRNTSLLMGHIG